jgi:hypothetical protein
MATRYCIVARYNNAVVPYQPAFFKSMYRFLVQCFYPREFWHLQFLVGLCPCLQNGKCAPAFSWKWPWNLGGSGFWWLIAGRVFLCFLISRTARGEKYYRLQEEKLDDQLSFVFRRNFLLKPVKGVSWIVDKVLCKKYIKWKAVILGKSSRNYKLIMDHKSHFEFLAY